MLIVLGFEIGGAAIYNDDAYAISQDDAEYLSICGRRAICGMTTE